MPPRSPPVADRPPLTPERLTRLRAWAERHHPDGLHGHAAHLFDGSCPWCAHSEPGTDATLDGNAHDIAVDLIDEVTRLRQSNIELAIAAGMDPQGGREFDPVRRLRGTPLVVAGPPAGWGQGTPVQVEGRGPLLFRVAPPDQQDHRDGRITVTCSGKTLCAAPHSLTYVGQAALVPGERVHFVGGHRVGDWGTVTSVVPGTIPAEAGTFVRWDGSDQGETGPFRPDTLERPTDVVLKWGVGHGVTHRSGWDGRIVGAVGAVVAVARAPYHEHDNPTWHHISDLISRTGARP
jgi:hypothetical protein